MSLIMEPLTRRKASIVRWLLLLLVRRRQVFGRADLSASRLLLLRLRLRLRLLRSEPSRSLRTTRHRSRLRHSGNGDKVNCTS